MLRKKERLPRGRAGQVRLYHLSARPGLRVIDPARMGSGAPSAETARGVPEIRRTYWYRHGSAPERIVAQGAPHRYETAVPASSLYDLAADRAGLVARAVEQHRAGRSSHGSPQDAALAAIRRAGHAGYYNSESALPHVVALFRPVRVDPVRKADKKPNDFEKRSNDLEKRSKNVREKTRNLTVRERLRRRAQYARSLGFLPQVWEPGNREFPVPEGNVLPFDDRLAQVGVGFGISHELAHAMMTRPGQTVEEHNSEILGEGVDPVVDEDVAGSLESQIARRSGTSPSEPDWAPGPMRPRGQFNQQVDEARTHQARWDAGTRVDPSGTVREPTGPDAKINARARLPRVKKSDRLTKMAIRDLPRGRGDREVGYDYSNLLDPQHRQAGYSIRVVEMGETNKYGQPSRVFNANLYHRDLSGRLSPRKVGYVNATVWDRHLEPHSNIHEDHQGQGLGVKLYEAAYAHGMRHHGAEVVSGGEHSGDAHRVHESLARRHGLRYQADQTDPDYFEGRGGWSGYRYELKSEPTQKAESPLRRRRRACRCDAYRFPHRPGGGACSR